MNKVFVIIVCALILTACTPTTGAPVSVESAGAIDYQVKFLFEKNGVSVFRFYDKGHYRYFTIGNGSFQPQVQTKTVTTSNGKTSSTRIETWQDGAETK